MEKNEKIKNFLKENNISATELKQALENMSKEEEEEEIKEIINSNKKFVGRYFVKNNVKKSMFPPMKKYYKIISERAENEYRVSCLVFDEFPTYWFGYISHKSSVPGDYLNGSFDFTGIKTESIMTININSLTEITEEEYNKALKKYIERLIKLEWPAEHYHFGAIMPSDPQWKKADKIKRK
jgi:hypothetical protein